MNNGLLKLSFGDFGRGAVVAVLAATALQLMVYLNTPGFDLLTFNWSETIRVAVAAGIGYLAKNLLTDNQGNVLTVGSR